jgi:uncharacterized protein
VTLVADTGGLYALYDAGDRHHAAVVEVVRSYHGPIVVPLPVVAELDYFLSRYLGSGAALDFLDSLASGAFTLDHLQRIDLGRARELMARYDDLSLGFVDATVMAVAERLKTRDILTLDLRDFRAVGRHRHGTFVLRPADSG